MKIFNNVNLHTRHFSLAKFLYKSLNLLSSSETLFLYADDRNKSNFAPTVKNISVRIFDLKIADIFDKIISIINDSLMYTDVPKNMYPL